MLWRFSDTEGLQLSANSPNPLNKCSTNELFSIKTQHGITRKNYHSIPYLSSQLRGALKVLQAALPFVLTPKQGSGLVWRVRSHPLSISFAAGHVSGILLESWCCSDGRHWSTHRTAPLLLGTDNWGQEEKKIVCDKGNHQKTLSHLESITT